MVVNTLSFARKIQVGISYFFFSLFHRKHLRLDFHSYFIFHSFGQQNLKNINTYLHIYIYMYIFNKQPVMRPDWCFLLPAFHLGLFPRSVYFYILGNNRIHRLLYLYSRKTEREKEN